MSDSNEASEEMELDEASILWTKRLMVKELAEDLVWNLDTEKELDAAILYLIGHYFTPAVVDLDNAAVRSIWIDAHHKAWCRRLQERPPTEEELVQMYGEIIRTIGDDPKYGLPKRTRRSKTAKLPATILQFVTQGHDSSREDKTDEKNSADQNEEHRP